MQVPSPTQPTGLVRSDRRSNEVGVAVRLTDVSKSFGAICALDGITLELSGGATVALLGPNGAGKSTAIGIMLGLLRPDRGSARTMGMEPRDAVAGGRVGAMLQTGALPVGTTVSELLRFARGLYPAPMPAEAIVHHAGLRSLLDRSVDGLSGGESQRVRFAMAIAGDPDLVFLDEPTVGMDVESRRAFWDTMRTFTAAGRTILFATHYLEEADEAADLLVIVGGGRVLASGTPAALKATLGGRVIRFRLPDPDIDALGHLPGVTRVETRLDHMTLHSSDPDASLRALLDTQPGASDLEVVGGRLEDAFLVLTGGAAMEAAA